MTVKKLIAVILAACMLLSLFAACSSGEKEGAKTSLSPTVTDGTESTAGAEMTYQFEKPSPPEGYKKMKHFTSVRNMLYLSDGQKLFCMDTNGDSLEELGIYAPLKGYEIAALGAAYGGGLLVLEQGDDGSMVSFVSEDGTVDLVTDITKATSVYDRFIPQKLFSDRDGSIYIQTRDGALVISPDGESSYELMPDINSELISIALSGDGDAYVLLHEKLNSVYAVYKLNSDGKLGAFLCEKPEAVLTPQLVNGGESFKLLYNDGDGLYALDTESGSMDLLFLWINHGMLGPFAFDIWDMTDRVIMCRYDANDLYIFKESLEPERTVLRLAIYEESYLLSQFVSDFNKKSDKYKIIIDDYAKYDEGVPGAGLIKLNTEIQAGNIPDIIDLAHIPAEEYEKKGLLTDLYPLIDADPELDRSDLFQSYLTAYERDGALYRALMFFGLFCFVGKSEAVGTGHGWTLDEMLLVQEQYAPDAPGMGGMNRDQAVKYYLGSIYDEFIDREAGTCSFASDEFVKILEYVGALETEIPEEKQYLETVIKDEAYIYPADIYNIYYLMTYDAVFGDEEYTFKGVPSTGKNGIALHSENSPALAITTACSDMDGAWSFVRMIFTDYVSELSNGIRTSKKAMDAVIADNMTDRIWINDEGEEEVVYKMTGLFIHGLENYTINMDILLYAATREQADRFYELIDTCDIVWRGDSTIASIAEEELGPFFAGNRSAVETAEMIQNRAQIYVAEQYSD